MKALTSILMISLLCLITAPSKAQQEESKASKPEVEVYYFHNNHRCATCMAVESKSEKALKELYPEAMKSGKITFKVKNVESKTGRTEAEGLGIKGQCLMVVKGDQKIDLTDKAFLYCKVNPDKLKAALHEAIGEL